LTKDLRICPLGPSAPPVLESGSPSLAAPKSKISCPI
jgi:hypothetical protein